MIDGQLINEAFVLLSIYDCKQFHRRMLKLCDEYNIRASFSDFLFYRKDPNEYIGIAYQFLYIAPLLYLANSKAFMEYYTTLDCDFQYDLIDEKDIYEVEQILKNNTELQKRLFELMGDDARYVPKNER